METDPGVLLALVAVRLLGGQAVPAAAPVLKELKNSVKKATQQGLLCNDKVKLPVVGKNGKTTMKAAPVVALSDEGRKMLQQSAGAEVVNAAISRELADLRESLEQAQKALRQELVSRFDQAAAAYTARIDLALKNLPAPATAGTGHLGVVATPAQAPAAPAPGAPLRDILHQAYERLCCFREFQDRLVELPRLFHEASRTVPGLSAEAFRREIESLWDGKDVELHILNEVREAAEPDKGVRRDNKLYYFVFWKGP